VESRAEAASILARAGGQGPLVLKPLFGSQGRGLRLINHADDLPTEAEVSGIYYLQRFVAVSGTSYHDYRVFVIDGTPIAAMRRSSQSWITNVKQGGKPCATLLDPELASLATRAAEAVGASYCGVDMIRNRDGEYQVLEVNSMPAWSGLQRVTSVNIAHELAAALLQVARGKTVFRAVI
jgi:RimK family alpha-L-glutamate ligase